jgi:hypothetical protein
MEQRPGGACRSRRAWRRTRPALAAGGARAGAGPAPERRDRVRRQALASGALPGGSADDLQLPLSGNWSPSAGLALWNDCAELRFDRLQLANLTLERRGLTLCPPRGAAIVRYDGRGLRVAAGAPSLDVAGRLGETPIAIRSGPVGSPIPARSRRGGCSSRSARGYREHVRHRRPQRADRQGHRRALRRNRRAAVAVKLDVLGASGAWRYADGRLTLSDGSFRLADRTDRAASSRSSRAVPRCRSRTT